MFKAKNNSLLGETETKSIDAWPKRIIFTPRDLQNSLRLKKAGSWGHAQAVLQTLDRLNIASLLDPQPSGTRSWFLGLILARVLRQAGPRVSKSLRATIARKLKIPQSEAFPEEKAWAWLKLRLLALEKSLVDRHARANEPVFIRLRAQRGQVGSGQDDLAASPIYVATLVDRLDRPLGGRIFALSASRLWPKLEDWLSSLGLTRAIVVGQWRARDFLSLRERSHFDWLTLWPSQALLKLAQEFLDPKAFFNQEILAFQDPKGHPNERLIASQNLWLKARRSEIRRARLAEALVDLDKAQTERKRLKERADFVPELAEPNFKALALEDLTLDPEYILLKYFSKKYIDINYIDDGFEYKLNNENIANDEILDGLKVYRTSVPELVLSNEECISQFKKYNEESNILIASYLDGPSQAKKIDESLNASFMVTILARYVKWHMEEAWRAIIWRNPGLARPAWEPQAGLDQSPLELNAATGWPPKSPPVETLSGGFEGLMRYLAKARALSFSARTAWGRKVNFNRLALDPFQEKALKELEKIPRWL
ncbi:MAG: hypothetical protein LBT38_06975 [Deltaproteobacteria bacterium]|jgi:hypothetical protein|nr:hypothetical protein [Deltaproteobacteria bacterium]